MSSSNKPNTAENIDLRPQYNHGALLFRACRKLHCRHRHSLYCKASVVGKLAEQIRPSLIAAVTACEGTGRDGVSFNIRRNFSTLHHKNIR